MPNSNTATQYHFSATDPNRSPIAVVTGASSGIGAAAARQLAAAGFFVICAARREDRIQALAAEINGVSLKVDVTSSDDVDALRELIETKFHGYCDLLVNNAGGAIGLEPVAEADIAAWETMYATNVTGAARVTKSLLPAITAAAGTIIFITSTAADIAYEKGAGYCGVKAAEQAIARSLRLELCGEPVRICEIAPGLVHTEEFSKVRFGGDQAKADAVYAGVPDPLVAEDIADMITWVATRPSHVNIDSMVVRPRAQAAQHKLYREN